MSVVDIHRVVVKLVEVTTAALSGGPQVLDGRDYSEELKHQLVLIGYTGVPGGSVLDVKRSLEDGGVDASLYDVTVKCTAVADDGDAEFVKKRAMVQGWLVAVNDALEADPRLGDTVYQAAMTPDVSWYQEATSDGNSVEVDFTITVQVFA